MPTAHHSTALLVDYAVTTTPARIPPDALQAARDIVLDTLGAMLGACAPSYTTARLIKRFAQDEGGVPRASIVTQRLRTAVSQAALVNATLAYALDLESIHGPSITHAAAVVVPAAMAMAEARNKSGSEFLTSVLVGLDAADRISRAITPRAQYGRGFHPSAIAGAPAAALATTNILRLDAQTTRRALGLAATQASGLMAWESDPSENARPFNCGIAARNGVTATLLAECGFGAPEEPLDGPGGMLVAFGDERSLAEVLGEDLGQRFAARETQIKQFACCAFLQPAVEAIVELQRRHSIGQSEVEEVILHFPRGGAPIIDGNPLRSHSAQYVLAVALADRAVTFDDIAHDRRLDEPALAELANRVHVVHSAELDPEFPDRYTSRVIIKLRTGGGVESQITYPAGHPRRPLTRSELADKFTGLAAPVVGEEAALCIVAAVQTLEGADSMDPLTSLLRETSNHFQQANRSSISAGPRV